jgi:hypothetical protein
MAVSKYMVGFMHIQYSMTVMRKINEEDNRRLRRHKRNVDESAESKVDGEGGRLYIAGYTAKTVHKYTENSKQIFPEMKLRGLSSNSYIHVSVSDLYIPTISLPFLLQENRWTDQGNISIY